MTQKELADTLGISPSAVGMYEQNRRIPDADSIIRLADLFNCSTDFILGYSNAPEAEIYLSEKQKKVLELSKTLSNKNMVKLLDYIELLLKSEE